MAVVASTEAKEIEKSKLVIEWGIFLFTNLDHGLDGKWLYDKTPLMKSDVSSIFLVSTSKFMNDMYRLHP